MKEKVEQYAKGEFNVGRPKVIVSTEHLQLNIEAGSVYRTEFEVHSANRNRMKGMVYDSRYLFKLEPHNFIGREQTVSLTFDAGKWEKGEHISGEIYLVTDGGEFRIPYEIEIVAPAIRTGMGEINDMFQFASLAETNWSEAVQNFATEEFRQTFLAQEPTYARVHESLTKSISASQAMEEFLVYTHKKRSVFMDVADRKQNLSAIRGAAKMSILVTRSTWGFMSAEVRSDARFIQPIKHTIHAEDFTANRYLLEYMVFPEYLDGESGTGHIVIENIYQKIEVEITVNREPSYTDEPPRLFSNHHIVRVHQVNLLKLYLDFRTCKITREEYVSKSMYALKNLIQYCREESLYRLGLLHMKILGNQIAEVEEEFKRIDADNDQMVVGERESAYYTYLKALTYKDESMIKSARAQIEQGYEEQEEHALFYFWLLMFMSLTDDFSEGQVYARIEHLYDQGSRSPILYYELCDILNHEPLMLRHLYPLELSAIRWGLHHDYISEDVLSMCVELAGREHAFRQNLFDLIVEIDERYPSESSLKTICSILIRDNLADRKYHIYFARGIARGLKLIGIYECYIRSLDMKNYDVLPESVLRYLTYNNSLTEYEQAYVYANLIKNKAVYPSLFGEVTPSIENFMESQIVRGQINEQLLIIYKEFLKPDSMNIKYASRMTNIIFKRRFTCSNSNIRSILVSHREMRDEQKVILQDGVAYIDLVTDSAIITLIDYKGNRYTSTIPYRLEKLTDPGIYLDLCMQYSPGDPRLLAYSYSRMDHKQLHDAGDVNRTRDILECEGLSYEIRQQALLHIIEYYLDNYDGDILDRYLLQVDLNYLDKLHSSEIITGYIMRGMYRKAYEGIRKFGYGDVEISRLLRLASVIVTDTDIMGDEALTSLCLYLYRKGQFNDRTIQYLVFQYKADSIELAKLWETAVVSLPDARDLEENILAQLIFSDSYVDNAMDIFRSYYSGRHRNMVTKAFLKKMVFRYLIREELVPDVVFEYVRLEMANGEINDDLSYAAVLTNLSKESRLNEEQIMFVRKYVKQFIDRGIILPFFKAFVEIMELPQDLFLKTYLVYKGDEGQNVVVNYSVGTSELETLDFKPAHMDERIPGYYVQEFIVFHGEQLLYHFSDEYQGPVELIESDSIRTDAYSSDEPGSRFERINQMLISQEMRDDMQLCEQMRDYMRNQHIFEEILQIL